MAVRAGAGLSTKIKEKGKKNHEDWGEGGPFTGSKTRRRGNTTEPGVVAEALGHKIALVNCVWWSNEQEKTRQILAVLISYEERALSQSKGVS